LRFRSDQDPRGQILRLLTRQTNIRRISTPDRWLFYDLTYYEITKNKRNEWVTLSPSESDQEYYEIDRN
jgi:hypothetical protein